jgi:hypothetical protein
MLRTTSYLLLSTCGLALSEVSGVLERAYLGARFKNGHRVEKLAEMVEQFRLVSHGSIKTVWNNP